MFSTTIFSPRCFWLWIKLITADFNPLKLKSYVPSSHARGKLYTSSPSCANRSICIIRSEEHTSELQSRFDLVCRLLLEKKNICKKTATSYIVPDDMSYTVTLRYITRA